MDPSDEPSVPTGRAEVFFESTRRGDLDQVKELLAGDPELLFIQLPNGNSPALEALDSGNHRVTDYLAREVACRLAEGTVPDEHLYGAIHDLGEVAHFATGYPSADQFRREAEPVVVEFVHHGDWMLRYISLSVLGLHWDLRSHRETFRSMLFGDPEEEVRRMAAGCLGFVLRESRDWDATNAFLRKLEDAAEVTGVREFSYMALLSIWRGGSAEYRFFLRVLDAERPFEEANREARAREDWHAALQLSEQAGRVWEGLIDRDFIAALERGEEP